MNQTTRRNCETVSRNPHEGGRCISYCFNKHLNHPLSLAGVRPFEILNDRLCPIDTVLMKGDQMHVKDGDVMRSYLLPFLWVLSSQYLNLQPVAAFNQEAERHKFMCERGKMDPQKKSEKLLMFCY